MRILLIFMLSTQPLEINILINEQRWPMYKFSFLKSLDEATTKNGADQPKLTDSIKYEEYDVIMCNGKEKTVYIPMRETKVFESEIECAIMLTESSIRTILRKCNGVTEI